MMEFYERVSGARMHAAYVRPGGVAQVRPRPHARSLHLATRRGSGEAPGGVTPHRTGGSANSIVHYEIRKLCSCLVFMGHVSAYKETFVA